MAVASGSDDAGGAEPPSWGAGEVLPPAARERVERAHSGGTWTSALSTGAFAAVRSVGFEPVGQVMGSAVYHVDRAGQYWGYYDCQYFGAGISLSQAPAPVVLSGVGGASERLVAVFDEARRTALTRLRAECSALGGDGVVAAELTIAPFATQQNCLEFKVIGTAVRARGGVRSPRPFTCHLDGQGFAKLVDSGWVPVELLVGMSIGVTHDTFLTSMQANGWDNSEVDGWTELVGGARADSRHQLELQARSRGGDGVILANGSLRVWERACQRSVLNGSEARDRIAESTMIGTTVAGFRRRPAEPRTLAVLPLGRRSERLRARLAAVASSPYGDPLERARLADELRELGDQG
ncbi:heavy metal-binding domain-containing protein [Streptomyces montanisoli]|uniref:Heavy metal-binding domain-containing protein n=1 Tax=Streptomyces montanisoli TaxID=2798581 RepID=A0A940MC98_9ACTN|nr:heavy metal-binding domain-containing protein [Streptomyces montanisoli]MBP0458629.1 heavy metal-binding domain-containing protein [Streptomyces montanisoli]